MACPLPTVTCILSTKWLTSSPGAFVQQIITSMLRLNLVQVLSSLKIFTVSSADAKSDPLLILGPKFIGIIL